MRQVIAIECERIKDLTTDINKVIKDSNLDVIDVKFATDFSEHWDSYCALIIHEVK